MSQEVSGKSRFRHPAVIAVAVALGVFAGAGTVIAINSLSNNAKVTAGTSSDGSADNSAGKTETDGANTGEGEAESAGSVCGLRPVKLEGKLDRSPKIEWEYAGTTAFPVSKEFGPAAVNEDGIKYCFARTPEGAALAAAVGAGYAGNQDTVAAWFEHGLVDGSLKDELLANHTQLSKNSGSGRATISAFRLLSYDGNTAKVDVATTVSIYGRNTYISYVYPLVWVDGDWKVDFPDSFIEGEGVAILQELSGYVPWSDR